MKLIFCSLLLFFLNSYTHSSEKNWMRKIGNYKILITWKKWDEEENYEKLIITHKGKAIYSEGELGTSLWIGNNFDESLNGKDPYSGRDLTGNGVPNLIITKWNGGAHCCNFLSVFELSEKGLRKLITVDGGSYYFKIKDFDGDKIPEIEFWDWPIDYIFNSFSESAQGRVVLKFINGKYHVASGLMYKRRPNNKKLAKQKDEIRKSFKDMGDRVPFELLNLMMELSYTGYKELALKIADDTWPSERTDLKKFKKEFRLALGNSHYWSEFILGKY